ncbi:MAG: glycosyltransferase [Rhodobacteraceae bacterium]|nr:glycosyltransferase [Paracoccaceae bacterium]
MTGHGDPPAAPDCAPQDSPPPAGHGPGGRPEPGPLHVLVANVHFSPYSQGGATLVAERTAAALARRGHRVSVIAARPGSRSDAYTLSRTTPFPGVDAYFVALPPGRTAATAEDDPAVAAVVLPLAARLAPDIAHLHCLQDLGAGLLPGLRGLGIPTVLSFHDHWWVCARQFLLRPDHGPCLLPAAGADACAPCAGRAASARRAQLAQLARLADLRTAPSRATAAFCEASGTGPVTLWENGILPPGPDFAAARAGRAGPPVFGYLGGPSAAKGWPLLRAAVRQLGRRDLRFDVADGGVLTPWWRPQAFDRLPGTWRIVPRFAPETADAFYGGIDALIFPSRCRESFGLAVREALARGLRVIRTGPGGQAEHPPTPAVREIPLGLPEAEAARVLAAAIGATADEIAGGAPRTLAAVAVQTAEAQADSLLALLHRVLSRREGTQRSRSGNNRAQFVS